MPETSIFESENLFKELFDNMSSGVAIYEVLNDGEDFIFKKFNKSGEKINNIKQGDIVGKKLTVVFPGVKELGLFEVLQRVWKTGIAEVHPTSMYSDERIELWVHNYVFKIPSGNIVAIFDDITEKKKIEKALETSIEEYRVLVENAQSAIFYLGLDYKISSWNKTAEEIYGYKKNEAIGKTIDDLIPVEFIYETREEVEKEFFDKGVWKGEVIQYHKNGSPINILSASIIIKDEEGNPEGMVTINHNITKRHLAQQKFLDSELRFKSIFMESPSSITLYDSDGKLIDANKACLDLINVTDIEQIKGFDILDDPNMPKDIKSRILKGKTVKFEVLYDFEKVEEILRAGKTGVLYFDAIISPIYSEDRESVKYYLNQVTDITERKLSEKKLEESEERFRMIFEESPIGISIIDMEHNRVSNANTKLCDILGYTERELKTLKSQDVTHPNNIEKESEMVKKMIQGDISSFTMEKRYIKKNKEILWGNLTSSLIRDKEGNLLYGLGMVEDITKRKEAEQKLKESEENLRKLNEELELRVKKRTKELEESQRNYRNFLQNFEGIAFHGDLDFNFTFIQGSFEQITGYKPEEILSGTLKWNQIMILQDKEKNIKMLNQIRDIPNTQFQYEFQIKCRDNTIKWIKEIVRNISDESGRPFMVQGAMYDITEQKKFDEILKESEEKFRTITEQSLMGIMIMQDGEVKYVNRAFEKINGYSVQEMMDWPQNEFINIVHPDDVKFVIEQAKKKQSGSDDAVTHYQSRIISKSGKAKWVESFSKSFIYNGRFADFITIIDINDRKIAEQSLKESEEMFSKSFHSSPILMAITRMEDGSFIDVNNTYTQVLGYNREELIGQTSKKLDLWVKPEQRGEFIRRLKEYNKVDPFDVEVRTKSGKILTMLFSGETINLNNESHLIIIANDITERKKAEERLGDSEEKYRKAYYQTNLYRDVFAHDLNNMLQNINSSAELSSLYLNNPEKLHTVKELNEITREQVKRGQTLINNIRKITEIDESDIQLDKINLVKPLEKAIDILKASYQTRDINIQVNENFKKIFGRANSLLLDVYENLLINAVEHSENPKIEIIIDITLEDVENKKYIKMEFKDNGIGISDYRKKSIFEKGIRKDKRSKGMGLGLSLVKKIIDSFNGKIWVENKIKGDYSKGSNFVVLIPTT